MSVQTQKSGFSQYIHYIITAIIIFGFRFLPNLGPVTDEGMVLLGAFIGAVYGWSFINMLWPSILAFTSMGLELGMAKVVAAGLGSTVTWMLVFLYIIIGILNEYKITDNLVAGILTRKFVLGKPWVLFAAIIFGTFLCANLSGFGTLVIFLAFAFKMCELLNIEPYGKLPVMLGIGIALAVALAAIALPFKGTALTILTVWTGITGETIDYVRYMITFFPIAIFILILYILIARFVIRVDVSALKNFNPKDAGIEYTPMSGEQKIALLVLLWAILDLCLPSLLPQTWGLTIFLNKLTVFGQTALPVVVFMVVMYKGERFINFNKIASKHVPWDIFMMMGVIMPLASFLCADTTGIKELMVSLVRPLLGLGTVGFLLVLLGITVALTNFANNAVVGMIMMPVIYAFSLQNDAISAQAALMLLIFCTHFAFLTPGATPFAAIMIGNSDWIKSSAVYKYGIPTIIILFLCTLPVGYFWASFIC